MSETPTDTSQSGTALDELDDDDRYRLFADELRRVALAVSREHDGSLTLDELTAEVVSRTHAAGDADSVKIELHHIHLPLMQDLGIAEYDTETGRIDLREPASEPPAP